MPQVAIHAREEARVDQVQDGVLDAAAVEIDRAPVPDLLGIERQLRVLRIAEAEEVPRGVDERIHRVRLATRRAAAVGTGRVDELGDLRERRIAAPAELDGLRAAAPAGRRPAPAPCRTSRSRARESACPSTAAARCPSPSGDTAPSARRCLAARPRPSSSRWPPPTTRPSNSPEFTRCPGPSYASRRASSAVERRPTLRAG